MSKTPRDQALDAIKANQSVVINGKQYTLDNIDELPPLEEMVAGDPTQEANALESLRAEKKELEQRLAALENKKSDSKEEKKSSHSHAHAKEETESK